MPIILTHHFFYALESLRQHYSTLEHPLHMVTRYRPPHQCLDDISDTASTMTLDIC